MLKDGETLDEFDRYLKENFVDGKLPFDGIFCVTDSLAHKIIGSLRKLGLRVPEDIQAIGYDGIRHFGDLELTCSTIVQPTEEIAKTCVDILLSMNEETVTSPLLCLPISYAFGGTTKS